MRAVASIGFTAVRNWLFWPRVEAVRGVYDWSKPDADIAAIRGAGMSVILQPLWIPRWASDGKPAYEPYTEGCALWDANTNTMSFNDQRDYCRNPPHVDQDEVRRFGLAVGTRYRGLIDYWVPPINELGGDTYNPLIWQAGRQRHTLTGEIATTDEWVRRIAADPSLQGQTVPLMTLHEAIRRPLEEIAIRFVEGVRAAVPNAKFVGPEADEYGTLDEVLKQEALRPMFDHAVTIHPYPWGTDLFRRLNDEFMPVARRHLRARELWLSEFGLPDPSQLIPWTEEVMTRYPEVSAIGYHHPSNAVPVWFDEQSWVLNQPVMNDVGRAMQALIARTNQNDNSAIANAAELLNDGLLGRISANGPPVAQLVHHALNVNQVPTGANVKQILAQVDALDAELAARRRAVRS